MFGDIRTWYMYMALSGTIGIAVCMCVSALTLAKKGSYQPIVYNTQFFSKDSPPNRSAKIAATMGNHSSKKSHLNTSIPVHKPEHTSIETPTINEQSDEVDDVPATFQSPIQLPQTPLTESIAYHLTRIRQNNRIPEQSNCTQTPSILLRRRIASDLGFPKIPLGINSPMDPRSPNMKIPRTPLNVSDAVASTPFSINKRVGRKPNIVKPARNGVNKGTKTTKPSSENGATPAVCDAVTTTATNLVVTPLKPRIIKRKAPDGSEAKRRSKSVDSTHLTPKMVYATRPTLANGRMPLSVINTPSGGDEQTPINKKHLTPRPRSVSRIPVLKKW